MRYITPAIIAAIVALALIRKKAVYGDFTDGARGGLGLLADIFPPLVAILTATSMLRASGAMDILLDLISPATDMLGIPSGALPLILIRPFSGSGSLGVLTDILSRYGADSFTGRLASVISGSTETTFYCLAVYLSKTRVKDIRRAIPCAVIGDLAGIAASLIALRYLGL